MDRGDDGFTQITEGVATEIAPGNAAGVWTSAIERIRRSNEKLAEWRMMNPRPHLTDSGANQEWLHAQERFKIDILGEPEPEYKCPTCRDRGCLSEPDGEHSTRGVPCPDCSGWNQQKANLTASRIPVFRQDKTFENYDVVKAPLMKDVKASCVAYLEGFFVPAWLALIGDNGTGKTHLAYAIANKAALTGVKVRFWVVPEMLNAFRAAYEKREEGRTADEVIQEISYEPELLILDDLGTEKPTDWVLETMFQVVDKRYANGRPTVITSNKGLDEIEPRIRRRLKDEEICTVLVCAGPDFGRKGK